MSLCVCVFLLCVLCVCVCVFLSVTWQTWWLPGCCSSPQPLSNPWWPLHPSAMQYTHPQACRLEHTSNTCIIHSLVLDIFEVLWFIQYVTMPSVSYNISCDACLPSLGIFLCISRPVFNTPLNDTMVAGYSSKLLYDHPLVFMYDLAGLIHLVWWNKFLKFVLKSLSDYNLAFHVLWGHGGDSNVWFCLLSFQSNMLCTCDCTSCKSCKTLTFPLF